MQVLIIVLLMICNGQNPASSTYYDVCDVSCDVIYYVIAIRARRMVRIFFLPYIGNRSKSDPCSYELFCLESHILSFPKVLQIPPESPCIKNAAFCHIACVVIKHRYTFYIANGVCLYSGVRVHQQVITPKLLNCFRLHLVLRKSIPVRTRN